MNKTLILGAKGNLGSAFMAMSHDVVGWDREEIDVTDEAMLREKIVPLKPGIIINTTGYNAVDKAETDPAEFELAKKLNGLAPKYLAEVAKEINATLVHYVSDYVFDGEKGEYTEEDKTNPISNYGISKEMGEKNVRAMGGKYYLIRTSKLFGKPAASPTAKKSFFEIMLGKAKAGESIKLVDSERSCFTYTPDLAQATLDLITQSHPYGTYHLVNEGPVTWYQAGMKLYELADLHPPVEAVSSDAFPRPAKRPRSSVLLNTKLPKLRNYEEVLKEWLKSTPNPLL